MIESTISTTNKYGIKSNLCGVYKITNKITNDFYIGSSVNIAQRIGNHMNREVKLYPIKNFIKM